MAKLTPQQLEEELKKQTEDYGDIDDLYDQDIIGKDTEEDLKKVIGNDPDDQDGVGFSIAQAVEDDEEDIEEGSDQQEEIVSLEDLEEDEAFDDEDL